MKERSGTKGSGLGVKVYFIGVKGAGLTALAQIFKGFGFRVAGVDVAEKFFTDTVLKKNKISYFENFNPANIEKFKPELVVVSQAYLPNDLPAFLKIKPNRKDQDQNDLLRQSLSEGKNFLSQLKKRIGTIENVELKKAIESGRPILSYPQALALIFNQSFGVAVCGSHGKSTTTAMLGLTLARAGLDPTVLVGAEVVEWQSNARVKKKNKRLGQNIFVIEADEYRGAFLGYRPELVVLTNIDYDHPDHYKSEQAYKNAYVNFLKNLKGKKILITAEKVKTSARVKKIKVDFDQRPKFNLKFEGDQYECDAYLVYLAAKKLGVKTRIIFKALKDYQGLKRRFEIYGRFKGRTLIDDYAHHPTEVSVFYQSLKKRFPDQKIWIIFQPHTYTRTHFLFERFVAALSQIPNLIILKTFPSAREKEFLKKTNAVKKDFDLYRRLKQTNQVVRYFSDQAAVVDFLLKQVKTNEVVATVGAGDGWQILTKFKEELKNKSD